MVQEQEFKQFSLLLVATMGFDFVFCFGGKGQVLRLTCNISGGKKLEAETNTVR